MVPYSTILCCVITMLICLVLPVLILLILALKCKKQGIVSAWVLGAAGFFVTQILIRLPILTLLQSQSGFIAFSQNHPFLYVFTLAFTAGLFELAGRFVVAKLMRRNLTVRRSLAAGLGHGSIEAMILIGMTYVNNLLFIVMINTGTFDTLFSQVGGNTALIAQLELIRTQLLTTSPTVFLLASLERTLTMVCHVSMSMLVCYGIAHRKALPCTALCLGIHTLLDLTAGISLLTGTLGQTTVYFIIYAILALAAVVSLLIIRELIRRWNEKEVSHDPEV